MSLVYSVNRVLINTSYFFACRKNPLRDVSLLGYSKAKIDHDHNSKIRELISFSKKYSHYYAKKLSFLTDDDIKNVSLQQLLQSIPYLEKNDLRIGVATNLKVPDSKGIIRETTGSTGMPVQVRVDRKTLAAQLRARWNFFNWHGIIPGMVEGRFWGRMEQYDLRSWVKNFLLNRKIFTLDNRDKNKFYRQLVLLQNNKPDYFYGYPSLILKAAELFDNSHRTRPRPKVIFTTAEMLSETQRDYISSVFGCPVFQEYGCSEVDIIAFECSKGNYHLNSERLYVEFQPTESENHEIIITDLDNRCTPIIRYRVGDLVELTDKPCDCGLPFSKITRVVGRTSDRLVPLPDGTFFHAVNFAHLIEKVCERGWLVKQYRVDHLQPQNIQFKIKGDFTNSQKQSITTYLNKKLKSLTKNQIVFDIIFCDIHSDGKHLYYKRYF